MKANQTPCLIVCLLLACRLQQLAGLIVKVTVMLSSLTAIDVSYLESLKLGSKFPEVQLEYLVPGNDTQTWEMDTQADLVIDFTEDATPSNHLMSYLLRKGLPLVRGWEGASIGRNPIKSYVTSSEEANVLLRIAEHLSLKDIACIRSSELAEDSFPSENEPYTLAWSLEYNAVLLFIKRELKASGRSHSILLLNEVLGDNFIKAASVAKLDTEGFVYLANSRSTWWKSYRSKLHQNGLLYTSEMGTETAASKSEWVCLKLAVLVEMLASSIRDSSSWVNSLLNFNAMLVTYAKTMSIVNIQNSNRVIVGQVSSSIVRFHQTVYYPGLSTSIIPQFKPKIRVTSNSGAIDSFGNFSPFLIFFWDGLSFSLDYINQDSAILPNFMLELDAVSFGGLAYVESFSKSQISAHLDKFGVAYIASYDFEIMYNNLLTFRKFNITLPVVTITPHPLTLNRKDWPLLNTVVSETTYIYSIPLHLFSIFGWKRFALVGSDSLTEEMYVATLERTAAGHGIEIVNSKETRRITLTNDLEETLAPLVEEIVISKVRVIAAGGSVSQTLMKMLFARGAKQGDYIFIANNWLLSDFYFTLSGEDWENQKIMMAGAMMAQQAVFEGARGRDVREKYIQARHIEPGSLVCFEFELLWHLASSLDWISRRGEDTDDPLFLQKVIQSTISQGCSGITKFDPVYTFKTNDAYQINSMKLFEDGTWEIYKAALYYPYSSTIWKFPAPYLFGDNSTAIPLDTFVYDYECPFDPDLLDPFLNGKAVSYAVCTCIAVLMALITWRIWRRFWNVKIGPLTKRYELSIQDIGLFLTIFLEFLQYLSMGPSFSNIFEVLDTLSHATSLELGKLIDYKHGVYYKVLAAVIATCGLWVLLLAAVWLRFSEKCDSLILLNRLEDLADLALPLLGNACFLPILTTLINVFFCNSALQDSYDSAILDVDCYQECWKDKHIIYAALAGLGLISYAPLAILMRPAWQETQYTLHVYTLPLFLMAKTVFQVILVVLSKTLKKESELVHSFVFLAVIFAFFLFTIKFKPFNFSRANMWHYISFVGLLFSTVVLLSGFFVSKVFALAQLTSITSVWFSLACKL